MHLPKYTQARRCEMRPCLLCGEEELSTARWALGYKTCLKCGEDRAKQVKHTIAPINKSNYMFISDMETLKQLNPKRTT
jgi:transcription elongation factor Elf1